MSPEEAQLSQQQQQDDSSANNNKKAAEEEEEEKGLEKSGDGCKLSGKGKTDDGGYEEVGHPAKESEYEEVGHPSKEISHENMEKKSQADLHAEEGENKNEKGGVISDIVSDIQDFSSLKKKKSQGMDQKDTTVLTEPSLASKDDHSIEENGRWDHSAQNGKKGPAEDYEVMIA